MVKWSYRGITKCSPLRGLNSIRRSLFRVEVMPQTIKTQLFLQLLRLELTVFAKSSNCIYSEFVFLDLKETNLNKKTNSKGVNNNV
ncbi:MAG: hypothetical protein HeimAB125_07510 [Candidatus Heimdallarchaeota archaeon AB_125]|nr:MAG: hypothetical protein HeimAB125_07510 [Candidatus Heimdallarchaeota archaeon AB_125]